MKRAVEEIAKYGMTESMTVRRVYDGLSCRVDMMFREVILVPIFNELILEQRPSTDRRVSDGPSYLLSRV